MSKKGKLFLTLKKFFDATLGFLLQIQSWFEAHPNSFAAIWTKLRWSLQSQSNVVTNFSWYIFGPIFVQNSRLDLGDAYSNTITGQ